MQGFPILSPFPQTYFTGWTPLHFAAHNGFDRIVEILLEDRNLDINVADDCGLTPLFLATQNGARPVFELLLAEARKRDISEAVVNARAADGSGITPVFLCAQEGHLDLLETLVDAGANIDVTRTDGPTSGLMGSEEECWKDANSGVDPGLYLLLGLFSIIGCHFRFR